MSEKVTRKNYCDVCHKEVDGWVHLGRLEVKIEPPLHISHNDRWFRIRRKSKYAKGWRYAFIVVDICMDCIEKKARKIRKVMEERVA